MIDQAAQQISADNTELASAYIQKTSMEKALPEMEKRLSEVCMYSILTYVFGIHYRYTCVCIYEFIDFMHVCINTSDVMG